MARLLLRSMQKWEEQIPAVLLSMPMGQFGNDHDEGASLYKRSKASTD